MQRSLSQPDLDRLARVFSRYPEVQAVYLFGSAAEGRMRADSDLDLALVLRPGRSSFRKLDLLADLAAAGFCNVDLVALVTDNVVLQHEVVRRQRLIFRTPDFDHAAFFSRVTRKFLDFQPYLEVHRKAYKERMSHGQT